MLQSNIISPQKYSLFVVFFVSFIHRFLYSFNFVDCCCCFRRENFIIGSFGSKGILKLNKNRFIVFEEKAHIPLKRSRSFRLKLKKKNNFQQFRIKFLLHQNKKFPSYAIGPWLNGKKRIKINTKVIIFVFSFSLFLSLVRPIFVYCLASNSLQWFGMLIAIMVRLISLLVDR